MNNHYCPNCKITWILDAYFTEQEPIPQWCPSCAKSLEKLPPPHAGGKQPSINQRLIKLVSHDIPNIAEYAKSLENRLTALEKTPNKDTIIKLIDEYLQQNDGPESPLAHHITATVDAYLDTKDIANIDNVNDAFNNAINETLTRITAALRNA